MKQRTATLSVVALVVTLLSLVGGIPAHSDEVSVSAKSPPAAALVVVTHEDGEKLEDMALAYTLAREPKRAMPDTCDGTQIQKLAQWSKVRKWWESPPGENSVLRKIKEVATTIYEWCPGNGPRNTRRKIMVRAPSYCWLWLSGYNPRYARTFQGAGADPVYRDRSGKEVDPFTLWAWNEYPEKEYQVQGCTAKWIPQESLEWMQMRHKPYWMVHSSIRWRDGRASMENDWRNFLGHRKRIDPYGDSPAGPPPH